MALKNKQNVRLIEPCLELEIQYMDMVRDFTASGEIQYHPEFRLAIGDFPAYVSNCKKWEQGIDLPDEWVPESTFWLIREDNVILGTCSLRHKLSDKLRTFGGHIGYQIRPSQRKKDYGTTILKLALVEAKRLGLKQVLITCDDENIASIKIIERNTGILKDKCDRDKPGKLTRRYWIDLKNLTLT